MPRTTSTSTATAKSPFAKKRVSDRIIGQPHAVDCIFPYLNLWQSGLNPEGRPVGTFLLLGPTGTGKTHTVEALAEEIHGSRRNILRIDCAEFQLEHEVAKLIGAPPGYLGHRETQPALTQMKLNQAMSERANLAIVLFDEIEKAAPSLQRLLLGILDKGTLTLGDNTRVQFERTLVFMTSNLGAREMTRLVGRQFGLASVDGAADVDPAALEASAINAVTRHFSPEFVNRIDKKIVYNFLTENDLRAILDLELEDLGRHISRRLGDRAFYLAVTKDARKHLVTAGYEPAYGARHLKRAVQSELLFHLAQMQAAGEISGGDVVQISVSDGKLKFTVR